MTDLTSGRRSVFVTFVIFIVATFWASGCGAPAREPAARVAAPITPTVTVAAPGPSTPIPAQATTTPPPLPFSLALPTGWLTRTIVAPSDALTDLIPENAPLLTERANDLAVDGESTPILLAWPDAGASLAASELGLMALAIPADNLRLPTVVSATVASLVRSGQATVTDTRLLSGLRRGELVGQIDYQVDTGSEIMDGKQFIIHDVDARQLVILTFSGAAEKMEQFAPQIVETIAEIVRGVVIDDIP